MKSPSIIPKIALEEHFMAPGFDHYAAGLFSLIPAPMRADLIGRLSDFGEQRLAAMDAAGIECAFLSQSGPGIQGEAELGAAVYAARSLNEFLAEQIRFHPTRYGGLAALPMLDAKAAAVEIDYCVTQLGFRGAMVNGHSGGIYYDDPSYDVLWERMQALNVPFYLHPANAFLVPHVLSGHSELIGATWGWGVETASHALRILFSGVFDRFPALTVILGHMGEGLPFQRWRFDSRFAAYNSDRKLKLQPSAYIGSNILITTSGVCSPATLRGAIGELGSEAIMFSVDYPFESSAVAETFIAEAGLDEIEMERICYSNAVRVLGL